MLAYLVRRVGLALLIVLTAMTLLFAAMKVIPGDPAALMLGTRATPALKAQITAEMGLDRPLPEQLARFFGRLARGDLGTDIWTRRPVADLVMESLPHTLTLIGASLALALAVGLPLGALAAMRRGRAADRVTGAVSIAAIALPPFVIGLYLIVVFAVERRWLPFAGAGEPGDLGDQALHLVLPALALGLGWAGYLARFFRAAMLEVLRAPHIRTARAFGLSEGRILRGYALPIAIVPVVTLVALGLGSLLSGAILVEAIFARPGLGKLIVDAAAIRNFPVLQGGVLTVVGLYALIMPAADLLVAWIDPRVRAGL